MRRLGPLKKKLGEQAGIATAAVMVMSVVLTLIAFFILRAAQGHNEGTIDNLLYQSTVDIIKANIYEIGGHPQGWVRTVTNNAALSCVKVSPAAPALGETCAAAYVDVNVYYPHAASVFVPAAAAAPAVGAAVPGFNDMTGAYCATYEQGTTAGNGNCNIKARVRWRPFCSAACYIAPATSTPPYVPGGGAMCEAPVSWCGWGAPNGTAYQRGFYYISFYTPNDGYSFRSDRVQSYVIY